jgi:hypothetical protein
METTRRDGDRDGDSRDGDSSNCDRLSAADRFLP